MIYRKYIQNCHTRHKVGNVDGDDVLVDDDVDKGNLHQGYTRGMLQVLYA